MWITADACFGAKFVELYTVFAAIAEIDMYLKAHNKQEGCLQNTNWKLIGWSLYCMLMHIYTAIVIWKAALSATYFSYRLLNIKEQ